MKPWALKGTAVAVTSGYAPSQQSSAPDGGLLGVRVDQDGVHSPWTSTPAVALRQQIIV